MKRILWILLFALFLVSCEEKGKIEVLTPLTSTENETRRLVETQAQTSPPDGDYEMEWTVNRESGKFHTDPECVHVKNMLPANRELRTASAHELISEGKTPCMTCSASYASFLPLSTE